MPVTFGWDEDVVDIEQLEDFSPAPRGACRFSAVVESAMLMSSPQRLPALLDHEAKACIGESVVPVTRRRTSPWTPGNQISVIRPGFSSSRFDECWLERDPILVEGDDVHRPAYAGVQRPRSRNTTSLLISSPFVWTSVHGSHGIEDAQEGRCASRDPPQASLLANFLARGPRPRLNPKHDDAVVPRRARFLQIFPPPGSRSSGRPPQLGARGAVDGILHPRDESADKRDGLSFLARSYAVVVAGLLTFRRRSYASSLRSSSSPPPMRTCSFRTLLTLSSSLKAGCVVRLVFRSRRS